MDWVITFGRNWEDNIPQPEDIFLLCVVGGHFRSAVDEVNGGFALEGVPRMGAVRLLVFVEEYLALLQHNTNLLPRPERHKSEVKMPSCKQKSRCKSLRAAQVPSPPMYFALSADGSDQF